MSLFNRPTWAKSQTTTSTDDTDSNIFSHSNRSYRDIVAEQERKKQAKLEKKKAKEERRSSAKRESNTERDEEAAFKRRRISMEEDSIGIDAPVPTLVQNSRYDGFGAAGENPSDTSTQERSRPAYAESTEVVDLGDSDEENVQLLDSTVGGDAEISVNGISKSSRSEVSPISKSVLPPVEIVDDESDDEFADLARRAREERQQKSQQPKKSHTPDTMTQSLSPGVGNPDTGQHSLPAPPDPPVELFITSRLPDTREMIVYRKLSQNLADVRKVWCKRQGFTEEQMKDVFLIHGMRRVYDVTTCRSLGLEVDSFGNITLRGAENKEDVEKVHLEAVTEAIFKQIKTEKAQDSQNDNGVPEADNADGGEMATEQPQEESLIRLVLKAHKKPDLKLKVKPATTISKITSAYAKTHLQAGENAYLAFDGDRLNPDDEVQNTEISDMDCIEVRITSA